MLPALALLRNELTEPRNWTLESLPPFIHGASGICQFQAALDPRIGRETALAVFDNTPFVFYVANLQPFELHLRDGVIDTSHGPVFWLLFWLKNPHGPDPFAMWDVTLDPCDFHSLKPWWSLAHQTHWHLFVLGVGDAVLDMFQFENTYGLRDAIQIAHDTSATIPGDHFAAAKAE